MSTIAAAELKRRGVSVFQTLLADDVAIITIRGKREYAVLKASAYDRLREAELEQAVREAQADYAAGRISDHSIDAHLKRIDSNV